MIGGAGTIRHISYGFAIVYAIMVDAERLPRRRPSISSALAGGAMDVDANRQAMADSPCEARDTSRRRRSRCTSRKKRRTLEHLMKRPSLIPAAIVGGLVCGIVAGALSSALEAAGAPEWLRWIGPPVVWLPLAWWLGGWFGRRAARLQVEADRRAVMRDFPGWQRCQRLRLDGPTPCDWPGCDCS